MTAKPRRISTIIADDEPAARAKLKRLLAAHPDFAIVAEAENGVELIDAVWHHRPDLVMLDIRMPEIDGLSALGTFDDEMRPMVVFVTAFDEYAVRAFAEHALDYLLKPFDASRLANTMRQVRKRIELEQRPRVDVVREMLERIRTTAVDRDAIENETHGRFAQRVTIRSVGKVEVLPVSRIEWIEAAGNYVRLHTATARPLLRETLRSLAERLDPARFVRIHRGALVNLDAVAHLEPLTSGDHVVRLRSGTALRMSRTFRAQVQKALNA